MATLVDIFLQPSKVFEQQRERPTFLVPALVLIAVVVALTLVYFSRVDTSWYTDHMLEASGKQMTGKELAQAKASMPGGQTLSVIGAISGAAAPATRAAPDA